jgi:hypothetical protein
VAPGISGQRPRASTEVGTQSTVRARYRVSVIDTGPLDRIGQSHRRRAQADNHGKATRHGELGDDFQTSSGERLLIHAMTFL